MTEPVTWTAFPTPYPCWLHSLSYLYRILFSNGDSGWYCSVCGGESKPPYGT